MATIERKMEAEDVTRPDFHTTVLSEKDVERGRHRKWVGGHWDERGPLQLQFLMSRNMKPHHRLLDVGCGSFRAERFFVDFLEPGNYYGIDANHSVMQAGYDIELTDEQRKKLPVGNLRATDRFYVDFDVHFDFVIAQSVFTHIDLNMIRLCLYRVAKVTRPGGCFYATYFEGKQRFDLDHVWRKPNAKPKFSERNCYWYYKSDMRWVAKGLPWEYRYIGDWGSPAGQKMLQYVRVAGEAEVEPRVA